MTVAPATDALPVTTGRRIEGAFPNSAFQPLTPRRNPSPGDIIRTRNRLHDELLATFGTGADTNDVVEYLIENDLLSEKAYAEFGVKA